MRPVTIGTPQPSADSAEPEPAGCIYDSSAYGDDDSLTLTVQRTNGDGTAMLMFESLKPKKSPPAVHGVGDDAFQDGTSLTVRKGSTLLLFDLDSPHSSPERRTAVLKTLGTAVARRI